MNKKIEYWLWAMRFWMYVLYLINVSSTSKKSGTTENEYVKKNQNDIRCG